MSLSKDGGSHWTKPEPWTYDTGEPFFSPSACSNLVRHSSGKLFWLGHISATNPRTLQPLLDKVGEMLSRDLGLAEGGKALNAARLSRIA